MALKQHKLCNLRNIYSIIHIEDKLEQEETVLSTETLALLSYQITFYHAFENVELDFAGSRYCKEDFCSTKNTCKCYILLFMSCVTTAVHLD